MAPSFFFLLTGSGFSALERFHTSDIMSANSLHGKGPAVVLYHSHDLHPPNHLSIFFQTFIHPSFHHLLHRQGNLQTSHKTCQKNFPFMIHQVSSAPSVIHFFFKSSSGSSRPLPRCCGRLQFARDTKTRL